MKSSQHLEEEQNLNQRVRAKTQQKERRRANRSIGFLIFVIILLVGVVSVQVSRLYIRNKELEKQAAQLQEELDKAIELEAELETYREFMFSDEYIEQLARERLNLIRPDEMKILPLEEP